MTKRINKPAAKPLSEQELDTLAGGVLAPPQYAAVSSRLTFNPLRAKGIIIVGG